MVRVGMRYRQMPNEGKDLCVLGTGGWAFTFLVLGNLN